MKLYLQVLGIEWARRIPTHEMQLATQPIRWNKTPEVTFLANYHEILKLRCSGNVVEAC